MSQNNIENKNVVENENNNDDKIKETDEAISNEDAILGAPPKSNRVIVKQIKNKVGLRSYLIRARRILRLQNDCIVISTSNACNIACEVIEILKKERIAQVHKIRTGLIEDNQNEEYRQPKLEVILTRGEFGHLISDFRRRKVIEVFEIHDRDLTGVISADKIHQLNPAQFFRADDVRKQKAEAFLKKHNDQLDLPGWIQYCSILIHPLLLEYHFKTAIEHFGGAVDVHQGDLPPKMPQEQILHLQRMGLYDNDEKKENVMDLNTFNSLFNQWNGGAESENDEDIIDIENKDHDVENELDNNFMGPNDANNNNNKEAASYPVTITTKCN